MTIETARRASLEFVCVFGQDGVMIFLSRFLVAACSERKTLSALDNLREILNRHVTLPIAIRSQSSVTRIAFTSSLSRLHQRISGATPC